MRGLQALAQRCQRQARVRGTYHACLSCERRGRKSAPRLCSQTFRIVCQKCGDSPDCIPPIDMVGRVVTVQSKQLFLAPCCSTIQEYAATGADFNPPSSNACPHVQRGKTEAAAKKKPKFTCGVWHCHSQALPKPYRVVDHLEGCLETVHLCHKHTPPEEWLKKAKNFRQFSTACKAWEAKCKPQHRR